MFQLILDLTSSLRPIVYNLNLISPAEIGQRPPKGTLWHTQQRKIQTCLHICIIKLGFFLFAKTIFRPCRMYIVNSRDLEKMCSGAGWSETCCWGTFCKHWHKLYLLQTLPPWDKCFTNDRFSVQNWFKTMLKDNHICNRSLCLPYLPSTVVFGHLIFLRLSLLHVSNSVDSDQMSQNVASDPCLHLLPRPVCPNTWGKYSVRGRLFLAFLYPKINRSLTFSILFGPVHQLTNWWIVFYVFPENCVSYFMQNVSLRDNLQEMWNSILGKIQCILKYFKHICWISSRKHVCIILTPLNPTFI